MFKLKFEKGKYDNQYYVRDVKTNKILYLIDVDKDNYRPGVQYFASGQYWDAELRSMSFKDLKLKIEKDFQKNRINMKETNMKKITPISRLRTIIREEIRRTKLREFDEDEYEDEDDGEDYEDDSQPDDYDGFIDDSPSTGYNVSINKKFLGKFEEYDDAVDVLKQWMEKNNWNPTVWRVSDHGNYTAINIYESVRSRRKQLKRLR